MTSLICVGVGGVIVLVVGDIRFVCFVGEMDRFCVLSASSQSMSFALRSLLARVYVMLARFNGHGRSMVVVASILCVMRCGLSSKSNGLLFVLNESERANELLNCGHDTGDCVVVFGKRISLL